MNFLHNIAIIGAGVAGISAARHLRRAGKRVQIFDKGQYPGGRMSSHRNDHGLFDLGAQYFTIRDPALAALIDECCQQGVVVQWPDVMAVQESSGWQTHQPSHPRYTGSPSMEALIAYLASDLDVRCGVCISAIEKDQQHWTLVDQSQHRYEGFDHVIVALPAPQAAALLGDRCPPDIPASSMTPCWSTWLRLEDTLEMPAGINAWQGVFINDSPLLRWAARNQTRRGHEDHEEITLLARCDWSEVHLESSSESIAARMLTAFEQCYPRKLPDVVALGAYRWRHAQPRKGMPGKGYILAPLEQLSLCGDWCLDGRVEAAWQSGTQLAQALCQKAR